MYSAETVSNAIRRAKNGESFASIAKDYGCNRNTIRLWLRQEDGDGTQNKRPKWVIRTDDRYAGFLVTEREAYASLANAIVSQAAQDYVDCIFSGDASGFKELLRFFYSGYFSILTDLDPEYLMMLLDKEARRRFKLFETENGGGDLS